ncbi:TIGR04282 family arsenosugar biosynthesis glycosyltransferase [Pseudemcibacter aquimaris]|uniref:TIGR04282 family arsenosugar biosynthesis glycosyltransferase n=1 Tax=Pseudemcibacter aquimaris TaxID=2857064 RepID=UPI00237E11DB|nr:TIGR04282 family arsenosugar biosynthesis glycosyltransferase [Pseudemcibacter aquimaris]MCC3860018.1 TIGR04282 family arsenosugar biosynthesis glycosyltransferase [Pseudemcibacter aquimaris]WDU57348.1 TIGR04282 family arsenosugar biosynthesis glycosyltransferase [Pseudemcibacter aquimaris]
MQKGTLVIFVKAPQMGRVKTRLARDIGKFRAWRFYRRTVSDLIKRVGSGNWNTVLCVSPDGYKGGFFDARYSIIPQGGGDLGQRMQRVFDEYASGPLVLIGGDIPSIGKHHIKNAFDALRDSDITFGPATDGGYWMVGMRRRTRRISPFFDVRWSTKHALSDTVENIDPINRISFTDMLSDVDEGGDL